MTKKKQDTDEKGSLEDRFKFDIGQQVMHRSNPDVTYIVTGRLLNAFGIDFYYIQHANLSGQILEYQVPAAAIKFVIR